jgi:hypothetical protein
MPASPVDEKGVFVSPGSTMVVIYNELTGFGKGYGPPLLTIVHCGRTMGRETSMKQKRWLTLACTFVSGKECRRRHLMPQVQPRES